MRQRKLSGSCSAAMLVGELIIRIEIVPKRFTFLLPIFFVASQGLDGHIRAAFLFAWGHGGCGLILIGEFCIVWRWFLLLNFLQFLSLSVFLWIKLLPLLLKHLLANFFVFGQSLRVKLSSTPHSAFQQLPFLEFCQIGGNRLPGCLGDLLFVFISVVRRKARQIRLATVWIEGLSSIFVLTRANILRQLLLITYFSLKRGLLNFLFLLEVLSLGLWL